LRRVHCIDEILLRWLLVFTVAQAVRAEKYSTRERTGAY